MTSIKYKIILKMLHLICTVSELEATRYYETVETRYPVPLPYCGNDCKPKWLEEPPSSDNGVDALSSEESQIAPLTIDIPDPVAAGLPQKGDSLPVKNRKQTVILPVPNEDPLSTPKIPEVKSACDQGKGASGKQSPIPLGRSSKWKMKAQKSRATKELPKTGQRVSVNKFYGRLRDRFYMQNDGYNLVFYLNENQPTSELTMKVKEWDDEYVFAKGILHWGSREEFGSEHVIHGVRFPLELQFVHYKSSLGSLSEAIKTKYGVMIASVVYDFSGFEKNYLEAIVRQAGAFAQPGKVMLVHGPLSMAGLFPGTLEHFEYEGSWTTAPCASHVRRIVFERPVGIGRDQLYVLRHVVRNANGTSMVNNFRKLQEVGGRQITFNPTFGQFNVQNRDSLVKPQPKRHW